MATEGRPLHPALDRQRLQGLPMTLRRHAIAAWESTASVESLHRLVTWTKTSRMRDSDRPLLLPICFVHLDPNLIPSREQLATLDDPEIQNASTPVASQVERVPHAVAALQLFVAAADAPYGSEPWLWPRLWGWFQFLDTHFDLLSAVHLRIALNEKEQSRGMNALVFVQATHWFSRTSEVLATQGLKEVIGRALSRLLHAENLKTTFPPWSAAANIISSLEFHDLENPRSLAELAEGIGGRGRLAEIIVTLMRRLADAAELSLIDGERLYLIRSLAGMLQRADGAYLDTERRESNLLAPPRKLSQRLLRLNIVPMLVRTLACISLTTSPSDITVQTYTKTHSLLMRLLATTIGARWIDQALDAGLLDTLIQSSRNGYFVGHDIRELRRFFTEILPQALTYHHTVASLHGAGTRIESHLGATDFRASPFYDILVTFIEAAAAQQAVSIKEFLRMLEASMNRSCDNLACEVVEVQTPQLRIRMKCCSSCRVAYYCTKACQAIDWKAGHRYVCCRYTSWSPARPLETILRRQDRSLLRVLLHQCYDNEFSTVMAQTVTFLSHTSAPSTAPFIVLFDWGKPALTVSVFSALDDWIVQTFRPAGVWSALVRQAQDSEGRRVLHLARLKWLGESRYILVPLHLSSASGLDRAVRELAGRVKTQRETNEKGKQRICDEMIAAGVQEMSDRLGNSIDGRGMH